MGVSVFFFELKNAWSTGSLNLGTRRSLLMDSKSPKSHWSARNSGLMSPCRVSVSLSCMFPASVLMMRSFSFRTVSLE